MITAFKSNFYMLVDSLTVIAGGGNHRSARQLLDALLSEKWIAFDRRMIEEPTGAALRGNVKDITNDLQLTVARLIGTDTREQSRLLVATAMNKAAGERLRLTVAGIRGEMTGVTLRNNLSALRDSLLNDKTNAAIRAIVDSTTATIAYRMRYDVNPTLQDNLSFIQRNATTLLIVLGVVALVIIVVLWRLKQKYAKMTRLVASQIYSIPDQIA